MKFEDQLAILERVAMPVWIFDIVKVELVWANSRGLTLWGANTLAEFRARDFKQISAGVRTRMNAHQEAIESGRSMEEQITFYPRGVAMTVRCHVSGITMDDGRIVVLFQAMDALHGIDPEQLRGIEALRHIWAIVSLLDDTGAVLMQNPAGVRAFGTAGSFQDWFADGEVARSMDAEVRAGQVFRAEVEVRTLSGPRWHALEGHRTTDPVSSMPATLVLQLDVTAIRESRQTIARQQEQIRALSVPILDVGPGVLALPLIGSLDQERSAEISAQLLPRVVDRQARSVILDLTAVDGLDAAGTEALKQVVQAIALLGARPIITGIQPALAQSLAESNTGLAGVLTLRDLHQGLTAARKR